MFFLSFSEKPGLIPPDLEETPKKEPESPLQSTLIPFTLVLFVDFYFSILQ